MGNRSIGREKFIFLNLAIVDLLFVSFIVPIELYWKVQYVWEEWTILCKIFHFFKNYFLCLSSFIIVLISYNRYQGVVNPINSSNEIRRTKILLILSHVFCFKLSIPQMDYYCISLNDLNYGEVLDKYNRRKEKMQLDDLIADYQDLFVYELHENAFFNRFSIEIRVSDRRPIFKESYDSPNQLQEVVDKLFEMGTIEQANPNEGWRNFPNIKWFDNEWQLCVDYKQLNKRTDKINYYVPNIRDVLKQIPRNQYVFSKVVLKDGFKQLVIEENDRYMTAFDTGFGFFQYARMNSQLLNSKEYLQMAVEKALSLDQNLNKNDFVVYLGQILIFSKTYHDHFETLASVFYCLNECNLKIGIQESYFFMDHAEYLGAIVDRDGLSMTEDKKRKIIGFPEPRSTRELRSFLGLIGQYKNYCLDTREFDYLAAELRRRLNDFYLNDYYINIFNRLKNLFR